MRLTLPHRLEVSTQVGPHMAWPLAFDTQPLACCLRSALVNAVLARDRAAVRRCSSNARAYASAPTARSAVSAFGEV